MRRYIGLFVGSTFDTHTHVHARTQHAHTHTMHTEETGTERLILQELLKETRISAKVHVRKIGLLVAW